MDEDLKKIIKDCKNLIKEENLKELKEYYNNLSNTDLIISNLIGYEYIFQKIFIYACQYGNKEIIEWLFKIYEEMDNIRKIGLRQLFFYGKYQLKSNKNYKDKDINWYDELLDKVKLVNINKKK